MNDITAIIEALVKLIVAVLCVTVIPYIRNKYSTAQLESARVWIDIAVQAAEQLYSSTQGSEKKNYVVGYLLDKGIKVDVKDLDKLIEASVLELHSELYGATKETETNRCSRQ